MKPEELFPYIKKNQPNICQINVLQNGQEVWFKAWNGLRECAASDIVRKRKD